LRVWQANHKRPGETKDFTEAELKRIWVSGKSTKTCAT